MSESSAVLLENRLRKLEIQLGLHNFDPSGNNVVKDNEIVNRLDALERYYFSTNHPNTNNNNSYVNRTATSTSTSSISNQQLGSHTSSMTMNTNLISIWNEIDKLMDELSAGTALTHQTNKSAAPMLYRKQDIVASADVLKRDMEYISTILNLISIDNNKSTSSGNYTTGSNVSTTSGMTTVIAEEDVVNAPIVLQNSITSYQHDTLNTLSDKLMNLQNRTMMSSQKLDEMVHFYYQFIESVSEKIIVLQDDVIAVEEAGAM
jgi:uncharacterized coiled-coil protein SlyX